MIVKNIISKIAPILLVLLISGCSVKFQGKPASELTSYSGKICVIEHPKVRKEFLTSYKKLLEEKGFEVEVIPQGSSLNTCSLTSDYIGKWSWDFVPYMATANINLYQNGALIANASYSAPRGGWALTTKIYESTEVKIRGMLEIIFPNK